MSTHRTSKMILTAALALAFLPSAAPSARADGDDRDHDGHRGQRYVDCSRGQSINAILPYLNPGDHVFISGTCNENVFVSSATHQYDGVTFDGLGTATISGPDATKNVFEFVGVMNFTIEGLTVTGGFDGISLNTVSQFAVDHVAVQNAGRHGIHFQRGSSMGFVTNSLVTNNPGNGIVINEGSYVRVGFTAETGASQGATGPCTITNNAGFGIRVQRNATARIYVSTINNNAQDGVHIESMSYAEVATNDIAGNGKAGVFAAENSVLHLGNASGTRNEDNPNTSSTLNGTYGLVAQWGAYVQGRLGTMAGLTDGANFTHGANNNLTP